MKSVSSPAHLAKQTWSLHAQATGDPVGAQAQHVLAAVREARAPYPVLIGGETAGFHDLQSSLGAHLPLALLMLALSTTIILWLVTGSVVLPVKALIMNALTVGSATGLLVIIFQDGRLTGPLEYTSQRGLESTDFLVLAALAFALSTDYGVFLLTRIKEARDVGMTNGDAVAAGLQLTGSIVTSAAILLAVAVGAFGSSQLLDLKELGLGAAAAVLFDAFIVRAFLVPALMILLGDWNWWSPAPLRSAHELISRSHNPLREAAQRIG